MRTIQVDDLIFEVVDHIPLGYTIWNIGHNMPADWLPLCQLNHQQPFPGCCEVNTRTLKAIQTENAELLKSIAGFGCGTLFKAESFINQHKKAKPGTVNYHDLQRCIKALPILQKISTC